MAAGKDCIFTQEQSLGSLHRLPRHCILDVRDSRDSAGSDYEPHIQRQCPNGVNYKTSTLESFPKSTSASSRDAVRLLTR